MTQTIEIEVAPGIEQIALQELKPVLGNPAFIGKGLLQFEFKGDLKRLLQLKTASAVYLLHTFNVPRPKALLGHQHFHQLLHLLQIARQLSTFETFYIDAAGSESSVMQRLKSELAAAVGIEPVNEKGDLLLRLRPSLIGNNGWDALIRLTPRPLATRPWRVQNYEGALNAAVAHAMILLTQPTPTDIFLNLCCGSGTLLIERFATGKAQQIFGCDLIDAALHIAQVNSAAAHVQPVLLQSDVCTLPFPDQSVDKLCADLPFGQLVGTHSENASLYPAVLAEAARVATTEARFVIITHEIRLIESLLKSSSHWRTLQTYKITLNGLHPRIYVLQRI